MPKVSMEGGIKFYAHHLPRFPNGGVNVTEAQQEECATAVARSLKRMGMR